MKCKGGVIYEILMIEYLFGFKSFMAFGFISFFPGLGSRKLVRGSSLSLVTPPLVCEGSLASAALVTPPLVCEVGLASGVLAGDSSLGLLGESASTSPLESGRGIEMLLSILTWGLL